MIYEITKRQGKKKVPIIDRRDNHNDIAGNIINKDECGSDHRQKKMINKNKD